MAEIKYDVSNVRLPFPLEDPGATEKVPRRSLPPEHEPYRLYGVDELGAFPPVDWLIDGYLASGELTGLYGKGATYKSFIALGWSAQLAKAGHTVVYIAAEGASGLKARVAAWQKRHGEGEALGGLQLMPSNVQLHERDRVATWLEAISGQLDSQHPHLVVVDTLARNFVGGSENNPQDMGLFVDGVERIRRELGTAVLVIHHTDKEGRTERGTESLRNASFAMLKAERIGGSADHYRARLTCDRMKDAEPPQPLTLRFEKVFLPELGEALSGSAPVSSLAMEPFADAVTRRGTTPLETQERRDSRRAIDRIDRRILRLARDAKEDAKALATGQIVKRLAVSRSTALRRLRSLVDSGFLREEGAGRGRGYSLTEAGEAEVSGR